MVRTPSRTTNAAGRIFIYLLTARSWWQQP